MAKQFLLVLRALWRPLVVALLLTIGGVRLVGPADLPLDIAEFWATIAQVVWQSLETIGVTVYAMR